MANWRNSLTATVDPLTGKVENLTVGTRDVVTDLGLPKTLAQSAIPVIIPSSGSIAANGALTLTTALPAQYANAFLYFPANAVFTGSGAGFYYVIMSSTSAGTIYQEGYLPSTGVAPTVPTTPTPWVVAGPGAYTQTVGADLPLRSVKVAAGSLGVNGRLEARELCGVNNTAGAKLLKLYFANAIHLQLDLASQAGLEHVWSFQNRGAQNINIRTSSFATSYGYKGMIQTSVDTSVIQTLEQKANLAVATDYFISEGWAVVAAMF